MSVILFCVGSTFLLGSWSGVLLRLFLKDVFARRAMQEGRMLQKRLKGHSVYMDRVRYRLIPHVWWGCYVALSPLSSYCELYVPSNCYSYFTLY
ncbi:MAG TPA: hypothetical protein VEG44_04765 [Candidatus Acidoferrales bacterium]|nr:hypothetical protein [Candidatus Acidoferrales bacterium]